MSVAPIEQLSPVTIRPASKCDIDALLAIESRCFEADRLSRRSFRHFITKGRAALLVAELDGGLAGYVLVLFRSGTALARIYSVAVLPEARAHGLGNQLMVAAESAAVARDGLWLRLEVRPDNASAIALYRRLGYRPFDRIPDYYEDHSDALRMQKALRAEVPTHPVPPYFPQSTDFTCGPAALMMAMAAVDSGTRLDQRLEFRLWREATLVFMSGGHGGCEPFGLALASARRGFAVAVHVSQPPPYFVDGLRNESKREVMTLIQDDFRDELKALKVPVRRSALTMPGLREALDRGMAAVLLVSQYRMVGSRTPHWLVAFGHDDRRVFVHDPWVDPDDLESPLATADLPIPWAELDRMARFGRSRLQAAVLIGPRAAA
ncbi:MAG: GNAT family N-acetyltransferase/peptidase C39 family protein [Alphaproteobacteria bacterium]